MKSYRVQAPDGSIITVQGPDNATDDQIIAAVQGSYSGSKSVPSDLSVGGWVKNNGVRNLKIDRLPDQRSGFLNGVDSFMRNVANGATAGIADHGVAALDAILPVDKITNSDIKSIWDGSSFSDAYNQNLALNHGVTRADQIDHPTSGAIGNVAGAVVSPLGKLVKGTGLLNAVANGAIYGGIYGGARADPGKELSGALNGAKQGGAGSAIGYGVTNAIGRVASPIIDASVRRLHDAGVPMTFGQIMGGPFKTVEDKATSVPGLGDLITRGRRNSVIGFNRAAINEALDPIGVALPDNINVGRDAAAFGQRAASDAYNNSLTAMHIVPDPAMVQSLQTAAQASTALPDAQRQFFQSVMDRDIAPFMQGSALSGDALQSIKRGLDKRIAALGRPSATPADELAIAPLQDVRDAIMSAAERQNPDLFPNYVNADAAYARMQRINDATARMRSDKEFSPLSFAGAVAKRGYGTTTQRVAAGDANMQQLADDAAQVLPSSIPDSGTAGRSLLALLGLGGLGHFTPQGATATAATAIPYIPGVDRTLQTLIAGNRPAAVRATGNALQQMAPYAGLIGAPVFLQQGAGQ